MCIIGNTLSNIIEHCYMIILIKYETNLKIYVKIKIFTGGYIYMWRSQKCLSSKLSIILISLNIQWKHI